MEFGGFRVLEFIRGLGLGVHRGFRAWSLGGFGAWSVGGLGLRVFSSVLGGWGLGFLELRGSCAANLGALWSKTLSFNCVEALYGGGVSGP